MSNHSFHNFSEKILMSFHIVLLTSSWVLSEYMSTQRTNPTRLLEAVSGMLDNISGLISESQFRPCSNIYVVHGEYAHLHDLY